MNGSINRTTLELKQDKRKLARQEAKAINRTTLELKPLVQVLEKVFDEDY